jgi:hypothetical protein
MRVLVLLALVLFSVGCGAGQPGDAETACRDFDLDVKKVWNAEVKLKVDAAVKNVSGELGASRSEAVATQMDSVTRDWVMLKESACLDHFKRGILSAEEYKAKVDCFDAFLRRQREMLTALNAGDASVVDRLLADSGDLVKCQ